MAAHHLVNGPNTGRKSEGMRIIKKMLLLAAVDEPLMLVSHAGIF